MGRDPTTEGQSSLAQCSGLIFGKILNVDQVSIPEVLCHLSTQSTGSLTKTEYVHQLKLSGLRVGVTGSRVRSSDPAI